MKPDIGSEPRFLPTPPAFDASVRGGGSRRNIAMSFGTEKLEWCGYPTVKNFEDMFIRFDTIHERDGRTDTHTHRDRMTVYAALYA